MEEDLKKIKEKIVQSGLSLEAEVASILERGGWLTIYGAPYLDPQENRNRTLDVFALKIVGVTFVALYVECKRSEKHPWAFYVKKSSYTDSITSGFSSFFLPREKSDPLAVAYRIIGGKDEIYEGVNQVSKAMGELERVSNNMAKMIYDNMRVSLPQKVEEILPKGFEVFSIPLIVFDGLLLQFTSYQDFELQRVGHVNYLSLLPSGAKIFRVINREHFEKYLQEIENTFQ